MDVVIQVNTVKQILIACHETKGKHDAISRPYLNITDKPPQVKDILNNERNLSFHEIVCEM